MPIVTNVGAATTTTLLVSAGTTTIAANSSASLLQAANVNVTGSGTTVLFMGRVKSNDDNDCQVELNVDGVTIFAGSSGEQIIAHVTLSVGSHTVTYTAFALNNDVIVTAAGLIAIDLGL